MVRGASICADYFGLRQTWGMITVYWLKAEYDVLYPSRTVYPEQPSDSECSPQGLLSDYCECPAPYMLEGMVSDAQPDEPANPPNAKNNHSNDYNPKHN